MTSDMKRNRIWRLVCSLVLRLMTPLLTTPWRSIPGSSASQNSVTESPMNTACYGIPASARFDSRLTGIGPVPHSQSYCAAPPLMRVPPCRALGRANRRPSTRHHIGTREPYFVLGRTAFVRVKPVHHASIRYCVVHQSFPRRTIAPT